MRGLWPHCSVPFLQTLHAIERYRGADWAESPLATPFAFVVLSATPPRDIPEDAIFPGAEREQALDHSVLHKRLKQSKLAELIDVKTARDPGNDPLVAEAVKRAQAYVEAGKRRVGVIVNRVRTAQEVARRLREQPGDGADIVLLTGRMRAFERDRLVDDSKPYLRATRPDDPSRPIVLVSTQCLEVGADFSFGALVTECASLDALRQRFGRLARMGAEEPAPAAIIVRESEVEAEQPDPIYGAAPVAQSLPPTPLPLIFRRTITRGARTCPSNANCHCDFRSLHRMHRSYRSAWSTSTSIVHA